jgi:hypothetical protein
VNSKVNSILPYPVFLIRVRRMHRSLFPRLLLIFALLFAQLGGLMHGISHIPTGLSQGYGQSQGSDQSLPQDKHCDLCDAFAQISSAIGSNSISFASSENFDTLYFNNTASSPSHPFVAFAARAPPYSA